MTIYRVYSKYRGLCSTGTARMKKITVKKLYMNKQNIMMTDDLPVTSAAPKYSIYKCCA